MNESPDWGNGEIVGDGLGGVCGLGVFGCWASAVSQLLLGPGRSSIVPLRP